MHSSARSMPALLLLVAAAVQAVLLLSAQPAAAGCPYKHLSDGPRRLLGGGGSDVGVGAVEAPHDHPRRSLLTTPDRTIGQDAAVDEALSVEELDSVAGRTLQQGGGGGGKKDDEVDYAAVKEDIRLLLTDSQDFWPADFGNYGPLFIRMAWHCAGTYRQWDGRGGCDGGRQVFNPELSWGDNANLDKTHRLLTPIKVKYGPALSWGDLIILAGTSAIEFMGGPVLGFCGGRVDDADGSASEALVDQSIWYCPLQGNCTGPLGQTVFGNIYVDPAGHLGVPDPSGEIIADLRRTFGNMAMNDTEMVVLSGAHGFGKTHGACPTGPGPSPEEDPFNPFPGTCGEGADKGKGRNAFTSGFEVVWTTTPTRWGNEYYRNLLEYDWVLATSPANKPQWIPQLKAGATDTSVARVQMLTSDVALIKDPLFLQDVQRFAGDLEALNTAFAATWYKLVSRDMGPVSRCKGPWVPPVQPFQNPLPERVKGKKVDYEAVSTDIAQLLGSPSSALEADTSPEGPYYGALFSELAWRCASTFRITDYRGGCNGAYIRMSPQKDWPVNAGLDRVIQVLQPVKDKYPEVSWADLIVLAGNTAVREAARDAGNEALAVKGLKFCAYRVDALTPGDAPDALQPRSIASPTVQVKDDAIVAGLTPREAVALAGRLRSTSQQKRLGYSGSYTTTDSATKLSNEYFVKLYKYDWVAQNSPAGKAEYKAVDESGTELYMTQADIALKVSPPMGVVAQEYAHDEELFHRDFAAAWMKVMNADRFDAKCH